VYRNAPYLKRRNEQVPNTPTVASVAQQIADEATTERTKAVALHDYVRDRIKFGFNKHFDAGNVDYILACGVGHCNPKTRLMVALFQAAGLESAQHFVVIPKDILKGAIPASRYWMIPAELSHSYTEVLVDGTWCSIDSYLVDTPLLRGAQARLAAEGRTLGYGARADSTNVWDGQSNAFSQFDQGMMIEDHGRVQDLESYFRSEKYRNHVMGLRFNTMFRLMGDAGVAGMNAHLDKLRKG
jgi:transglutaminase-like putative cysteine protease